MGIVFAAAKVFAADTNVIAATPPVYVPDYTHANDPLPDGVLAWDNLSKAANAAADQAQVHFIFNFTNISGGNVVILNVHPSCGCTTAELPPLPWMLAPGTNGQIGATVNIAGKSGTLFKKITVSSDKGQKDLNLQIIIQPPVMPVMSDAARAAAVAASKIDRQAIFHGDCASCHVKRGEGKYGRELFDADCAICHEAEQRAMFVPDLHNLKTPTNPDFWATWIAHGKPGSFMAAFSTADGGPLSDMQIASLAAYLDQAIPSHVPPVGQ